MSFRTVCAISAAFALTGCCCGAAETPAAAAAERPVVYAAPTGGSPVGTDGKLDAAAWDKAPVYTLLRPIEWKSYYKELPPEKLAAYGDAVLEPATLQVLYDDDNLYLGFNVTDREVKAKGTKDQEAHFVLGDLIEVFIKPDFRDYYWELYSTPTAKKTAYEFVSQRKGATGNEKLQLDFTVDSFVNGTVNDGKLDDGWTTVFTIPRKSLAKYGDEFTGDGRWTLLIGRYNYLDSGFVKEELSAYPQITKVDFHALPEYAAIKFMPEE
ncbi:MAG: carbohydrate-binding family 9-like protein [Victivallaceae bacterium]|nr:carbohydrate-binding family 9-like protein [Victivallaceae bacterium]